MKNLHFSRLAVFAGCALLLVASETSRAQSKGAVVEEIIARVNNRIVTLSEYQKASQALPQEVQQDCPNCAPDKIQSMLKERQKNLLRDMIDQQLLVERAKDMDISVETDLIKRLDEIRKIGDRVTGAVRAPREGEKYWGLIRVDTVNGVDTAAMSESLTPFECRK